MDDPLRFIGHDERASPISFPEGPACRVRCAMLDYPFHFHGHDKRAPLITPSEGSACCVREIPGKEDPWLCQPNASSINTTNMTPRSQANPLTGSTIRKHATNNQLTDFPHKPTDRNFK